MDGARNAGTTSSSIVGTELGITGMIIRAVDDGELWSAGKDGLSRVHSMGVILAPLKLRAATIFSSQLARCMDEMIPNIFQPCVRHSPLGIK